MEVAPTAKSNVDKSNFAPAKLAQVPSLVAILKVAAADLSRVADPVDLSTTWGMLEDIPTRV